MSLKEGLKLLKEFLSALQRKTYLKRTATLSDIIKSSGILLACSFIGLVFYFFHLSEANIITVYVLGILLISSITYAQSIWNDILNRRCALI